MSNEPSRAATREDLAKLHALLHARLVKDVKSPKASAELLGIVRDFLRDNNAATHVLATDPKVRAQLQRLYGLLLQCLLDAAEGERISPAMAAQVLAFLKWHGNPAPSESGRDAAAALRDLKDLDVPFPMQ